MEETAAVEEGVARERAAPKPLAPGGGQKDAGGTQRHEESREGGPPAPTIFLLLLLLVQVREEVGKQVLGQNANVAANVVVEDEAGAGGGLVEPPPPRTATSEGLRGRAVRQSSQCSHGGQANELLPGLGRGRG